MATKICPKCETEKDLHEDFGFRFKHTTDPTYAQSWCKNCRYNQLHESAETKETHREKVLKKYKRMFPNDSCAKDRSTRVMEQRMNRKLGLANGVA